VPAPASRVELLSILALIDEAFDARAWHGPTLRRAVSGVTPAQAMWRPAPGRHNILEVVAHAAYWKHEVRWRLRGRDTAAFTIRGIAAHDLYHAGQIQLLRRLQQGT